MALPDGLLRAEIEYGPPLKLHDVTVYKLDSDGHLAEVDTAARATPLTKELWRLEEGRAWHASAGEPGNVLTTSANREEAETPFRTRDVAMLLDELWLRNLGLSPQYLRLGELKELAHARIMSRDLNAYQTRSQLIFGEVMLTVTMALVGASLAMLFFAFQTRWIALVGVLLAGYLAHFGSKAFQLMGEFGYMAPFFAGWLAPILLILAVIWVLHVIQKRRGLGSQLGDTPRYLDSTSG
jgi:lipopolysaccharide export LptBFGC system permease protein LptF